MIIDGRNFDNFVYVDPSLPDKGDLNYQYDGLTPETAKRNVPTLQDNTIYLIRRTSGAFLAPFPMGTYTGKNIFILGMPKPGEIYYDIVPDVAKTAWGNDTYEYGNLLFDRTSVTNPTNDWTNTNMHYCVCTKLEYFNIQNCSLQRFNTATQNKGPGYMFVNSETSAYGYYKINNCKFGVKNIELNQEYADTITAIPSEDLQRFGSYLNFNFANLFSITNSTIDHVMYTTAPDDLFGAFCGRNITRVIEIVNNKINFAGYHNRNKDDYMIRQSVFQFSKGQYDVIFNNNTLNLFYQNNRDVIGHFGCFYGSGYLANVVAKNNKYTQTFCKDFSLNIAMYSYYYLLFENILSWDIDDLSFDFRDKSYQADCACFLYVNHAIPHSQGINKRSIKNINFIRNKFTNTTNPTLQINCDVTRDYENFRVVGAESVNTSYVTTLENINIRGGYAMKLKSCNVLSGEIYGHICLENGCYVNLDKLVNPIPDQIFAVNFIGYNAGLRVKEFDFDITIDKMSPQIRYDGKSDNGLIYGTFCVIEKAPKLPFLQKNTSSTPFYDRNSVWCCNDFGGNRFYLRNNMMTFESSSITNDKSESNASIKITSIIKSQDGCRLKMTPKPIRPIVKSLSSGKYDLVFQFALNTISIEAFVNTLYIPLRVKQNDGIFTEIPHNKVIIETSDAIWTDNTVTAYKLTYKNVEIPFADNGSEQNVEVEIPLESGMYDPSGYAYFDINPTITKVG